MAPDVIKQTALVTGGAVRLGREIALALAQSGYNIALHYGRSVEAAQATKADIEALGVICHMCPQDLADVHALDGFIKTVYEQVENLTVLVNSASAYENSTITNTKIETFDTQFTVNLRAPFFLTKAFARYCGVGNIINILDNKIMFNQFDYAAYLLSKKALAELTRMAAIEFAPDIRVNGIAPGVVMPAVSRSEEYVAWRVSKIPLQKQGNPGNITRAIDFCLKNDFMTGQIIVVDGGEGGTNVGFNFTQFDDQS